MHHVPAVRATLFNLGSFSTEQALSLFRFVPAHVRRLATLLRIEEEAFPGRQWVSSVDRLFIVLRAMSSPARWVDVEVVFRRCSSILCSIFYEKIEALSERWGDAIFCWHGDLMEERAATYGFKVDMASVRVADEWGYKEVKEVFPTLDYNRKMKINE